MTAYSMSFRDNPFHRLLSHARARVSHLARQAAASATQRPTKTAAMILGVGMALGAMLCAGAGYAGMAHLRTQAATQQAQLDATRDQAQREVNALAARLGELQAEANRLNALGERLTRTGQLADGEFDFDQPVGIGGAGPVHDMPPAQLRSGLDRLESQFKASGEQLSVLESLLFNRKLDAEATPSRTPIANSYITSGFGGRADPFGGGAAFHKGIDFHAAMGDPVLAVADGVVSYAGTRSGYGNVVEIDHGNGYVTRYAHNSRLLVQVGDLVRSGQQVARAGSTGRSTGAHVHFEVWADGRVVNPSKFLGRAAVTRG
ncbi:peptidoglycan DD-metalloendopeptidase family protein [Cognatiluteimonas profundi]|uniref:M23 family metallopeptidase n=1 Tax=Cognatiluteimonas profundi TaxID=2594501 RepID=UPI003CCDDCBB